MSTSTGYVTRTEGPWTYVQATYRSTFTVTDSRTGESHDSGATVFPDARRFVYELSRTQPVVTMTIASGPQRARAGHQRYTTHFA